LALHLPLELATVAAQGKQRILPQLTVEETGGAETGRVRVMRVSGNFTGPLTKRFAEETQTALAEGADIVLDLSASTYMGSDALGLLIRVAARFRFCRRELWLTGLRPPVIRTLRTSRAGAAIRTAPKVADALRRIGQQAAAPSRTEFHRGFLVARGESQPIPPYRQGNSARSSSPFRSAADRSVGLGLETVVDCMAATAVDR
jgi:anti-anti-sigma factor